MILVKSLSVLDNFKTVMPTLTRLVFAIVVVIALIYGSMVGLVYLVKPVTADMTIDIAPENLHLNNRPPLRQQPTDSETSQN